MNTPFPNGSVFAHSRWGCMWIHFHVSNFYGVALIGLAHCELTSAHKTKVAHTAGCPQHQSRELITMRENAWNGKQNIMDQFLDFSGNWEMLNPQTSRCQVLWPLDTVDHILEYRPLIMSWGKLPWFNNKMAKGWEVLWNGRCLQAWVGQEGCEHGRLLLRNGEVGKIMGGAERQVSPFCWSISIMSGLGNTFSKISRNKNSPMWGGLRQPVWAEQEILQSGRD